MNKPTLFTFSEARNIEELEWLLRLRYRIFQETHPGFYPLSIKRIFKHTKRANKMKQIAGLYAFREIKDEVGLLAAFRLRYQTYFQQPHLRQLITVNTAEVDIDGYDVYSRHYGLYKINGQSEEMIGYLRVIVTESTVAIFFYDSNHQNAIISHSEAHERLYQSCFFRLAMV